MNEERGGAVNRGAGKPAAGGAGSQFRPWARGRGAQPPGKGERAPRRTLGLAFALSLCQHRDRFMASCCRPSCAEHVARCDASDLQESPKRLVAGAARGRDGRVNCLLRGMTAAVSSGQVTAVSPRVIIGRCCERRQAALLRVARRQHVEPSDVGAAVRLGGGESCDYTRHGRALCVTPRARGTERGAACEGK